MRLLKKINDSLTFILMGGIITEKIAKELFNGNDTGTFTLNEYCIKSGEAINKISKEFESIALPLADIMLAGNIKTKLFKEDN